MSLPADSALQLPHVWRGKELAQAEDRTLASGHPRLDALLPGGGWPLGSLVEVLQLHSTQHVWQLLLPALVAACGQGGPVVLVGAPHLPFGPALRGQGLPAERLLCVQADRPASRLWAAEQALRCGEVAAVLAWLPRARSEDLRRLHLVAQSQADRLFVAFREANAQGQSSPARLRLLLEGTDRLQVRILKRRGPPVLQPVSLRGQSPRLAAWLESRGARTVLPRPVPIPSPVSQDALDRTPAWAG